ncbi:8-oxo-dGTP diphosphatase [Anaerobacillus sp. MEB173]|uniref:8-oxo-dGTP diphosphatase n=1 Tax=Anaerobacillus sp. MEB173 TaxID=3383345 RepID=UPI003F8F9CE5
MQRVTNCLLRNGQQVLLLQKPRRGWWVAPGGKMESGESIKEAVMREYREETGIFLKKPQIKGVFNFVIIENDKIISEWMMFTFETSEFDGESMEQSPEGKLAWKHVDEINELPMAPGDYFILDHMINGEGVMYGTFHYTPEFKLLKYRLDPEPKKIM